MTSGFLRVPIVPQTPAGPPMSLLDAAILPGPGEVDLNGNSMAITKKLVDGNGQPILDEEGNQAQQITGYRWEAGFQWKPRQCAQIGSRNECPPATSVSYRVNDESAIREHQPVILTASNPCDSALPNDWAFQRQSARNQLIAAEPAAAEQELWDGTLAAAAIDAGDTAYAENLWLTKQGVATDLTGGTGVSPQRALGICEQFLADTGIGGWGTIHCRPEILAHFNYDLHPSGRQLFSARNTLIVPGVGYTGNGPATTATGARTVTDGVTNTDTSLVSATAVFVAADVGKVVSGAGIPVGTTILSRTNGTTVVLSQATTATATAVHVTITGGQPLTPADGTTWMYATGRITYRQGEIDVVPDLEAQALLRTTNTVVITAQRSSAATWDLCAVGAVLVALPA